MQDHYHWQENTLVLKVVLQPKASSDNFAGIQAGRLRIRITAPPVDGKANKHLINFISKQFGITKSDVILEKGTLSRQKTLCIHSPKKIPAGSEIKTQLKMQNTTHA